MRSAFASLLEALHIGSLALWVGAMFGFGALTAPLLFRTIASRQEAGDLAGAIIWRLGEFGLYLGGLAALALIVRLLRPLRRRSGGFTSLGSLGRGTAPRFLGGLRLLLVLGMLALTLHSLTVKRDELEAAQAALDRPIEQIALDDPRRQAFDRVHGELTRLFGTTAVLGLAALILIPFDLRRS